VGTRTLSSPDVARVVMLMAIQILVISVGNVHEALLIRQFKFREMALNNLVGAVTGLLVALVLTGRYGFGVYGLVISGIVANGVMTVNRFHLVPWLPSRMFSWERCRRQLAFGSSLLGVSLAGYVNGNLDRTTIGTLLDRQRLGYFEYANSIPRQIVNQLGTLLNRALFPALATVQGDVAEFRNLLLRYIRMTSLVIYPMLVGLALVADQFVLIAYGPKWQPIVLPMKIVCIGGLINLIANSLVMVCNALGRPQLALKASIVLLPVNALLTAVLVAKGGLVGAAFSRCLAPIVMLPLLWYWIGRFIRLSALDLFSALAPALIACAAMMGVLVGAGLLWAPLPEHPIVILSYKVILGGAAYCLAIWIGWRHEVDAAVGMVRDLIGRLRIPRQAGAQA
jgi:teichuronic acid exporter